MLMKEFKKYVLEEKSKKTAQAYIADVKQFVDWLEEKGVNPLKLEQKDMKNYTEFIQNTGIKAGTANRKLVSVRQYLLWLYKESGAEVDRPVPRIDQVKIQRQPYLEDILTKAEFDRIVIAAEKAGDLRAVAILYCLLYTGCRVSEVLQIQTDILNKEYLTVIGKGNKTREVPVHKDLPMKILPWLRARKARPSNPYLFPGHGNQPLHRQSVNAMCKKYAGKARIKLTKAHPHNFRHLTAIELLKNDCDIVEVGDILGHSDPKTTAIYLRKTKEALKNSISKI